MDKQTKKQVREQRATPGNLIGHSASGPLMDYFSKREDIIMAFVFGSYARGREIAESDFDVAIYFKPEGNSLEWEEDLNYEGEDKVWLDVEKIVKRNVDLVVMNRAPSTLAFEILRTGIPIIIKDHLLCQKFFSRVSFEAIDFMELIDDYWAIEQRSGSLSKIDRQRLIKLVSFLEKELKDQEYFINLDWQTYQSDAHKRRDVERWVENIVNCSIDIAKILLASEKKQIPDTYKEMLRLLSILPEFNEDVTRKLAGFSKLRNILAHEYLDSRFDQIKKFIQESEPAYKELLSFVKNLLNR